MSLPNTSLIKSQLESAQLASESAKESLASLVSGGQGFGYTQTVSTVSKAIDTASEAWSKLQKTCSGALAQLTPDEMTLASFLSERISMASNALQELQAMKTSLQSYILTHLAPFGAASGSPMLPGGFGLPPMPASGPVSVPGSGGPAQRQPLPPAPPPETPGTVPSGILPEEPPWGLYALGAGAAYLVYKLVL